MNTRKVVICGLCIALGVILPLFFHMVPNAGSIFLPMHIPVLLCGLICGWAYGAACGVLAPLLSSLITQMPPAAILPGMMLELAIYGIVSGLCVKYLNISRQSIVKIYFSLIIAMLSGRIAYGIANALIFQAGQGYSMQIWLTAAFTRAVPGIIIQLIAIPAIMFALEKAKLIPLKA